MNAFDVTLSTIKRTQTFESGSVLSSKLELKPLDKANRFFTL